MKHQKLIYDMDNKIPLCVITDSIRIKQILSNLLSNAIKFTPEHGKSKSNYLYWKKRKMNLLLDLKLKIVELVSNKIK